MKFSWSDLQVDENGKILLLYRHERILTEGIVKKGHKVLDVGGWGVLASRLIQEGVDCTILDNFSEDQHYPERVVTLPYIEGDILEEVTLRECGLGTYDVVTCFEMLEHCKDQLLACLNTYRLLKSGGTLVGTFPIPGEVHAVDDPTVSFLSEEELRLLLSKAGFINIRVEPTASCSKEDRPCSLYFRAERK